MEVLRATNRDRNKQRDKIQQEEGEVNFEAGRIVVLKSTLFFLRLPFVKKKSAPNRVLNGRKANNSADDADARRWGESLRDIDSQLARRIGNLATEGVAHTKNLVCSDDDGGDFFDHREKWKSGQGSREAAKPRRKT